MTIRWLVNDRRMMQMVDKSPEAAEQTVKFLAVEMARDAQQNIRTVGAIDTGFMINTTRARQVSRFLWSIGTAAFYGVFIEFGTRFTSARPWLTPAMRVTQQRMGAALGKMLLRL